MIQIRPTRMTEKSEESSNKIEMRASYRIPGSFKFGTGSKMKPVLDT